MLLRRIAHLGVDHAVGGQVQRALPGHPVQPGLGLHHRDGVREGLQVAFERPRVGGRGEPPAESLRIRLGKRVADVGGELDDGLRAQATVQVVVQQCLGCLDDVDGRDGGHHKMLEGRAA
jgi:hypothetical protein